MPKRGTGGRPRGNHVLGADFRARRGELRLTQAEVAGALRINVRTVARAERGGPLTASTLRELCGFLALSIERVVRPSPEDVLARLAARGLTPPAGRAPPHDGSQAAGRIRDHLGDDADRARVVLISGPDGSGKRSVALDGARAAALAAGRVVVWLDADRVATGARLMALRDDVATALGFDPCLPDRAAPASECERAFRRELWKHDVLLVLSDVETLEPLAALVGDEPGARCIVTTSHPLDVPGDALHIPLAPARVARAGAAPASKGLGGGLSPEARTLLRGLRPLVSVAFDPWWVTGANGLSRLDANRALSELFEAGLAELDRPAAGKPRMRVAPRALDAILDGGDAGGDDAVMALADLLIERTTTLVATGWQVTQDWVVENRGVVQVLLDRMSPAGAMPSVAELATPEEIPVVPGNEPMARRLGGFLALFDLMLVHRPRLMLADWIVPALAATRAAGPRTTHAALLRIAGWWRTLSRLGHGSGTALLQASFELSLAEGDHALAVSTLSYLGGNALGRGQLEESVRIEREALALCRAHLVGVARACITNRCAVSMSMIGGRETWAAVAPLFDEAAEHAAPVNPWIEATARMNAATSRLLADPGAPKAELDGALRRFWALIPARRPMFEAVALAHAAHFGLCPDGLDPASIHARAKAAWDRWIFPARDDGAPPDPMAITNFLFFIAMWAPNRHVERPMSTGMATVNVSDAPVVRGGVDITDLLLVSVAAIERLVDDALLLALQASTDTFVCDGSFFKRDLQLILGLRGLSR